jgi:cell wall-associated NlpC family hydrolase
MLSFLISNAIIVSQALTGMTPCTLESRELSDYMNQANAQSITIISEASQDVQRDDITVNDAPRVQTVSLRSQIATQSLPASSSALVNSAAKYIGQYWDCTAVVEQALRDMGYSVADLGPMQFGQFGTVFYDPSQVQPGDILMRPGHVTIYAGDGMSIQGGFGFGGVVYTNWQATPEYYTAYVRIG